MFRPIVLSGTVHFVARADLLFTYCGICERQLAWRPRGGQYFYATCCQYVYIGEPMGIDLTMYTLIAKTVDMKNVRRIKALDIPKNQSDPWKPAPRNG